MNKVKIMSVLMLTAVLTACGSSTGTPPAEYTSRDACTAAAQEMNAAAYSCDPKTN